MRKVSCQQVLHNVAIINTNITKKFKNDDLFQKSFLLSEKNSDSFSRFILIFSLESPILQHFEEDLQTLKILPGGRFKAFCNSGTTVLYITVLP